MDQIEVTEDGKVVINLLRVLDEMSEEKKQELLSDGGWRSLVTDKMARELIRGISSETYNSLYHDLRTLLLNSEAMPEILRQWVRTMVDERERSRNMSDYWRIAYYALFKFAQPHVDIKTPYLPTHSCGQEFNKEIVKTAMAELEEMNLRFPEPREVK